MRLLDIKEVDFSEVMARYSKDHSDKQDPWEARNLERANEKFGKWIKAKIPVDSIGSIVMPHHKAEQDSEGRRAVVVPESGLILQDVYDIFYCDKENFSKIAPKCYEKIMQLKKAVQEHGAGSFFLSQEPLMIGTSYSGLAGYKGQITHLDGFHRLMAIMDLEKRPDFIEAYIAVSHSFVTKK